MIGVPAPGPPPRASVIIVNHNTRDRLVAALDSLPAWPPESLEVVVVDNASGDGSATAARRHPRAPRVVESPANHGFADGVNQGLARARGATIVLLNSDARLDTGALEALVAAVEADPQLGVAGGRIRNEEGSRQATAFAALPTPLRTWQEFGFLGLGRPFGVRPVEDRSGPAAWVSGAFMAFGRTLVDRIGNFDSGYFLYCEDIDWCRRAAAAGFAVRVVGEAGAVHAGRGSDPVAGRWAPRAVAARLRYHRKFDGRLMAAALRAALSLPWIVGLAATLLPALVPGDVGRPWRRRAGHLVALLLRAGAPRPPRRAPGAPRNRVALVATVDFPNGVGGETRHVHMLARSFLSAGWPATVLIPCTRGLVNDDHRLRPDEVVDGIDVLRLSAAGSYGHAPGMGAIGALRLFALRWIVLLRSVGPILALSRRDLGTLYLYQPTFYDGAVYWLLARATGCRIVGEYCDLSFVDHDRIERNLARRLWSLNYRLGMTWLPRRLDRAYAISRFLEQRMAAYVAPPRLQRVPPVVEVNHFEVEPPSDFLARRCGLGGGPVVLYAGAFFDNEGVANLLRAAPRILEAVPSARFAIVGGHPAEAVGHLRALADGLKLGAAVAFPGVAPSLDMPLYFRSAAVLVAPKADHILNRAGVPTKLVEYMASGRPVVASATGDIPILVDDGRDVILVPPDDIEALARAIIGLLTDPARAEAVGAAGRARVRRDYDVAAMGRRLSADFANGPGAPRGS